MTVEQKSLAAARLIENPVTGDRIEFLASPLHGDAGPLVFRCTLARRAAGSPLHIHRTLAETFEVERGSLAMDLGAAQGVRHLSRGERIEVAPGAAHGFSNPLDEPTTFVSTVSPGAGFERFLRTMYGLAADGRTTPTGMPRDPRALALTLAYADLLLAQAPRGPQRALLASLACLGRLSRLERGFERYWPAGAARAAAAEAL